MWCAETQVLKQLPLKLFDERVQELMIDGERHVVNDALKWPGSMSDISSGIVAPVPQAEVGRHTL